MAAVSILRPEAIAQLIEEEARPELQKLTDHLGRVQRCSASMLEMQTAGCLHISKAMAELLLEADQTWTDFSKLTTDAEQAARDQLAAFQKVKARQH